jgi:hypothetical protein
MNTTNKNTSVLEIMSVVALVSCVLSGIWFLATIVMA